jgi:hypothetical protein
LCSPARFFRTAVFTARRQAQMGQITGEAACAAAPRAAILAFAALFSSTI